MKFLIVSVFKLVQDLLESPGPRQKSYFQQLMGKLPENHKAKWFAGAALNTSDQAMASVMSTVLSRLNAFLDSELEQVICFDSAIDAETFASEKCAIFLILPEEDTTKNFMAGLMIQNLSRELFAVADEHGGKLKNRVVLFCDELGTMPPFDILPLFSAGRSRRLTLVPIIQSLAQLEKNYGKEGSEIIQDNFTSEIFLVQDQHRGCNPRYGHHRLPFSAPVLANYSVINTARASCCLLKSSIPRAYRSRSNCSFIE